MTETSSGQGGDVAAELPGLVRDLLRVHTQWLEAIKDHRAAIGSADAHAIAEAIDRQAALHEEAISLEKSRRSMLGLKPGEAGGATLTALAGVLAEPARGEVIEQAAALKRVMTELRRERSVVKRASESLLAHMTGVMTKVSGALNHAGVYARGGSIEAGPMVVSSLDISQ
jgi:hypothetical protein